MTQGVETTSDAELGLPSPKERRRLREAGRLTHEEVATAVGVTATTVRSWETGRTEPRGRKREAYAALLTRLAEAEGGAGTDPAPEAATAPEAPEPPGPEEADAPVGAAARTAGGVRAFAAGGAPARAGGPGTRPRPAGKGAARPPVSLTRHETKHPVRTGAAGGGPTTPTDPTRPGTPAEPDPSRPAPRTDTPSPSALTRPDTPAEPDPTGSAPQTDAPSPPAPTRPGTPAKPDPTGSAPQTDAPSPPAPTRATPWTGTPAPPAPTGPDPRTGTPAGPDPSGPDPRTDAPSQPDPTRTSTPAGPDPTRPDPRTDAPSRPEPTGPDPRTSTPAGPDPTRPDPRADAPSPPDPARPGTSARPEPAGPDPAQPGPQAADTAHPGDTHSAVARPDTTDPDPPPDDPARPARGAAARAFDALYLCAAPALVRQAYLLTGRRALARQAVEHAFRQAWGRWPEVATDPDPVGWVRAVTYEYALSPWQRFRRAFRHPDPGPVEPVDRMLLDALIDLPPVHRRTVLLYDGIGLDLPDTAAETEATTPAAGNRLLRAHATLAARVPGLADVAPEKQSAALRELLGALRPAVPLEPRSTPATVRALTERTARRWARAAICLTAAIAVATGYTAVTAPDRYVAPVSPGTSVSGVPPHSGPQRLTDQSRELRERLRGDPASGPARLSPGLE
ncbi:helix-turn-helix domain-containing protein [Streptomyces sp. SPB4]|uniref:helix-turn-helix domain-containing protein n=1 Tax=Streptomyces sp. SPB4 TaxID=2940553 RepID=UPI00247E848A|nr:DNA-directed RNA polymerase specialized sigma24 family protein [Streptomyces sp. SPB4]